MKDAGRKLRADLEMFVRICMHIVNEWQRTCVDRLAEDPTRSVLCSVHDIDGRDGSRDPKQVRHGSRTRCNTVDELGLSWKRLRALFVDCARNHFPNAGVANKNGFDGELTYLLP